MQAIIVIAIKIRLIEQPYKEQCFRQRYGVTARTQTLLWSPVGRGWIVRDWAIQPVLFTITRSRTEVRDITCIAKMQSVERVESASASLLAFPVRSSAPAECQNVSPNVSKEPDI